MIFIVDYFYQNYFFLNQEKKSSYYISPNKSALTQSVIRNLLPVYGIKYRMEYNFFMFK